MDMCVCSRVLTNESSKQQKLVVDHYSQALGVNKLFHIN